MNDDAPRNGPLDVRGPDASGAGGSMAAGPGIAGPGLEEGLAAFYLVALGIIGFGVLFFRFRSSLRSGNPAAVLLLILQLLMTFLLGRAVRRLLGGG
jgi:hypothetical protein